MYRNLIWNEKKGGHSVAISFFLNDFYKGFFLFLNTTVLLLTNEMYLK